MKDIIFINSHPIQYFAPLYAYCNRHGLNVSAWYCSDESIRGAYDVQFGRNVKWDIPLLQGYEYRFFKNYSWKPSIYSGFWGLINLGMINALRKAPRSVVVVHGWDAFTNIMVLFFAALFRHTVCIRGESPLSHEMKKSGLKLALRKVLLRYGMFSMADYFLYIGEENRKFYKYYGVKEKQLVFIPYAVDNERFRASADQLLPAREQLRAKMNIGASDFVFLFCGKYISKKRPMDMIRAFHMADIENSKLYMVGEGELRTEMEEYINSNVLNGKVILTGFVNQGSIGEYYALSDTLVICSAEGETWGLVVNEAMNFGLPVISSDLTGSSKDLVKDGRNGYLYNTGNINELSGCLKKIAADKNVRGMGSLSRELVDEYSYKVIANNMQALQN